MASQSDVKTIEDDGKVAPKRRFDGRDWDYLAEYVVEEYHRRKQARRDRERCWAEIDRQIAMEPNIEFKKLPNGKIDAKKHWMAETELPLQAQALEVLTADARRMLFPDTGTWFSANAALTDEYLSKIDFQSLILGDEAEVPSKINQDNANKLVEGYLLHLFRQQINDEDFYTRCDRINAEAFKYGVGVGRGRRHRKNMYFKAGNGVRKETQNIPVLQACSIKNLYLDDRRPSMHSVQLLEPAQLARDYIKLENLRIAANLGGTDPEDEDGGWMPDNLKGLVPEDNGYVTVLEMEGDIVVPRKTVRSVVIPGAIITVVLGGTDKGGKATRATIRFRFRKTPGSSYLLFPYHYEGADDAYPSGPLMKGRPVQMTASDATNRFLDSAALKNAPPVGYDRTDMVFAQAGGPEIYPYAQWGTTDEVHVYDEVGGDPSAMAAASAQFINLYADLTGVLPSRIGAQTKSHTTAYAKESELQRGAVRTVDYVRQVGQGPMTRWLAMAYEMGRSAVKPRESVAFFIQAYGGYVEVNRDQLPELTTFEWYGSGGPAEEQQKRQQRVQALALGMQIDQAGMAAGLPPRINKDGAIDQILREGGWTDLDAITNTAAPPSGAAAAATPLALLQAAPELLAAE